MKIRYSLVALLVVVGMVLAACGGAATPAPAQVPAEQKPAEATKAPEAPAQPAGGPKGEITLWHSYHAGEAEEQALTQALEQMKKDYPDLTVNVLSVPFQQIENKWTTEVAAGGGPDMFTMPNDNFGTWVRGGLIAPIDDLVKGKLDGFAQTGVDGMTYEGKIYGVPGIVKALGLFYNKDTVANPPKTGQELLDMVKAGKKIAIMQYAYHNFGWLTGAFGGTLMDADGKCIADQGGFAEALQYMKDLKAAGASFETDESKANAKFQQGEVDMMITGPWMLGTFKQALSDKLGATLMPAGPGGPATPLSGIDGWYVNPNVTPEQQQLAATAALYLFGPKGAQIYSDVAGDAMVAEGVTAKDPLVTAFAEIGAGGFPRPQSVEFGNWWGAFDNAITTVMEGKAEPAAAVKEACDAMNKASGK